MITRRFDPPLESSAGEITLRIRVVRLSEDGSCQALVEALRGLIPVHTDRITITNASGRKRYAKAVVNLVQMEESVLQEALLKLLASLPTHVASDDASSHRNPRSSGKDSQATTLVKLAEDAELFQGTDGIAYTTIRVEDHEETWRVRSNELQLWLRKEYYDQFEAAPNSRCVREALDLLESHAIFDGPKMPISTRIAEMDGDIYLDLANDRWETIRITSFSWDLERDPPVRFARARGMKALPYPNRGGKIDELRPFLNFADDSDFVLIVGWLIAAFRGRGPYPILNLFGEQGTGKSVMLRIIRSLFDPNQTPLRCEPRDERDLYIASANSFCIALDNLSTLPPWLSDALCRLSTGGGFSTRELYKDRDETTFDLQRPVMLNSIEEIARRGDLIDRSIIVSPSPIPEGKRLPEDVLWHRFEAARPRILGALLDGVVAALKNIDNVQLNSLPRMADFARWVTAAEEGLGWPPGTFLRAYKANRQSANDLALEGSAVADAVRTIAKVDQWEGTAEKLRQVIEEMAKQDARSDRKGLPANARALSGQLRRLAPNLRAVGIQIEFYRANDPNRTRMIRIRKV